MMHNNEGGGDIVSGLFWFGYFICSLFVAYYAMRFTAYRREEREKAAKRAAREKAKNAN